MAKQRKQLRHDTATETQSGKPRLYSYLRFSDPSQEEGDSVTRQVRLREEWMAKNGYTAADLQDYEDCGVSGFRGRHAHEGNLAAFLELVKTRMVPAGSILLVERVDRLSREEPLVALERLIQLLRAGVTIVTLEPERRFDMDAANDSWGLMELLVSVKLAHEESQKRSDRGRSAWRGKRKAAAAGKAKLTNTCPAWLRPTADGFEIDEDAARWVRLAFKLAIEGMGAIKITHRLNRESNGVSICKRKRTGESRKWHWPYVARILSGRTVLGECQPGERVEVRVQGQDRVKVVRRPVGPPMTNYYPAVISEEIWARAQLAIGDRAIGSTGPNSRRVRNLFGPLLTCARTGQRARVADKGGVRLLTGLGSCVYQPVEDAILRLFSPELQLTGKGSDGDATREVDALQTRLDVLEGRIKEKSKELIAKPDSPLWAVVAAWDDERDKLAGQLAEAKQRLASRPGEDMDRLREALRQLASAPEQERVEARLRVRAKLRRVVQRIYVVILRRPYYENWRLHWQPSIKCEVVLKEGTRCGVVVNLERNNKGQPKNDRDLVQTQHSPEQLAEMTEEEQFCWSGPDDNIEGEWVQLLDRDDLAAIRFPMAVEAESNWPSNYAKYVDPETLLGMLDEWASGEDAIADAREKHERWQRQQRQGNKADVVLVVDGRQRKADAQGKCLGDLLDEAGIDRDAYKVSVAGVRVARNEYIPRDGDEVRITRR